MKIQSINPTTGEVLESFPEMRPNEIDQAVEATYRTFHEWRSCSFPDRAKHMREAGRILRAGKEKYARTMALEMGKPIVQGEAEVEKCAWTCDYYAEHAEGFLADQLRETDASRSYIRFDPIGPVLAIMPWNFPLWQVFRFAAPALMAGNAAILKHASNVPRCALQIEEIFREAGFPENLFRTILVGSEIISFIIADARICAVTLTGSTAPAAKWRRGPATSSRRPCSSSAAAILSSFWRTLTFTRRPRQRRTRALSTAGKAVSRRSALSLSRKLKRCSWRNLSRRWGRAQWVTRSTAKRRSARRRATIYGSRCTGKCKSR